MSMEYIVKITDNGLKAKNISNLLKSLAEDYDFLEFLSNTDNLFELSER